MNSIQFVNKLLEDAVEDEYIALCEQLLSDLKEKQDLSEALEESEKELVDIQEEFDELDSKNYALEDQYETLQGSIEQVLDVYRQYRLYGLKTEQDLLDLLDNFEV